MLRGDITDKLRQKAPGDEGRYFRQEQENKLRKLQEVLTRLEGNQAKLKAELQETNELLTELKLTATEEDDSDDDI